MWADLSATFTKAGLPLPPIPEELRDRLQERGPWCWSTKPIDGFDMYMFFDPMTESRRVVLDVIADRVEDYAAVSHAGHGLNSYGINYHLVYGRIAIVMQVAWGGVHMDNAVNAQKLAEHWMRVAQLLTRLAGPDPAPGRRLLIVFSDFRDYWGCDWITAEGTYRLASSEGKIFQEETPFDAALKLWPAQGQAG